MIEVYSEDEALTPAEENGIRTACETALAMEGAAGDITVLVAGPEHIRQLNRDFRSVDRVTDVLTFPSREGEDLPGSPDGYLGDIMICRSRAVEQAAEYGGGVWSQFEPGAGLFGGPRHSPHPGLRPYERGGGAGHARPPADHFGKDR